MVWPWPLYPAARFPQAGDLGFHRGRTGAAPGTAQAHHKYLSSDWLRVILIPKQTRLQSPRSAHRWQVATSGNRSLENLAQVLKENSFPHRHLGEKSLDW